MGSVDTLVSDANGARLVGRALHGLHDLDALVDLQRRLLATQEANLRTSRSSRNLTAESVATARSTLAVALELLSVARQTLAHAANLDRKVGPIP